MSEQLRALRSLIDEDPKEYTLQDLFQRKPQFDAVNIDKLRQQYNQQVIPDKQLYRTASQSLLEELQGLFDHAIEQTNARDTKKYFPPQLQVLPARLAPGVLGLVRPNIPETAEISRQELLYGPRKENINTLLHEASHVDHFKNDTRKTNLFKEVSPLDVFPSQMDALRANEKKYFKASNWVDPLEIRANLRASLGQQPYGVTAAEHFGPLLDAMIASKKPIKYYPKEAKSAWSGVDVSKNKETLLKALEMDLFPRERWLESREPTTKEKIKDMLDALMTKLKW